MGAAKATISAKTTTPAQPTNVTLSTACARTRRSQPPDVATQTQIATTTTHAQRIIA